MTAKAPRPEGDEEAAFGRALAEALDRFGLTQAQVAHRLGNSPAYVSQLVKGRKLASGPQVDRLAEALGLPSAERTRLHRAAARDAGFRLELPDDF